MAERESVRESLLGRRSTSARDFEGRKSVEVLAVSDAPEIHPKRALIEHTKYNAG